MRVGVGVGKSVCVWVWVGMRVGKERCGTNAAVALVEVLAFQKMFGGAHVAIVVAVHTEAGFSNRELERVLILLVRIAIMS